MFEKAKLDTEKESFKKARDIKVKEAFQKNSRGDKAIQLERLGKKSPEAYKQVMEIDHTAQQDVIKIREDKDKKVTAQIRDEAMEEMKQEKPEKGKRDYIPKGIVAQEESPRSLDDRITDKKIQKEAEIIQNSNEQINAIGEKHGIDLGYGQGKEQSKDKSRT